MPGVIINIITQLFVVGMIIAIIGLSFWAAYLLYQKRERAKAIGLEDKTTNIVHRLIKIASFLADKIKQK